MRRWVGAVYALGVLLGAGSASAYCRTTTCDVDQADPTCTWDADNCATSGHPLFWPRGCTWFGVQKDGSAKRNITYDAFHTIVAAAYSKWTHTDCGGGRGPSLAAQDTDLLYGPVECGVHEFNLGAANANAWMFRDQDWPYVGAGSTIALTTLSVRLSTGEILDADTEINSYRTNLTTSDTNVGADLEAIVTHESGHFLGLAHSSDASASMYRNYSPADIGVRSLSPDDTAAICAAYPPGASPMCGPPEPLYGFSRYCSGIAPDTSRQSGSAGAAGVPSDAGSGGANAGSPSVMPPDVGHAAGAQGESSDASTEPGNDSVARATHDSAGCSCEVARRPLTTRALIALLLAAAALGRRGRKS